jgi:RNA polymerase sigma factor (sigma-70 family)
MKLIESLPKDRYDRSEEFALAAQIQKNPNEDALNDLVLHNMAVGFLYAKSVCRGKVPDDELFSLVYKTLYRNAKRFRPGGIRFLAFAKAGLRGALSRYWSTLNTVRNASEVISMAGDRSIIAAVSLMKIAETESTEITQYTQNIEVEYAPRVDPEFDAIHFRERMALVRAVMEKKLSPQENMIIDLVYTQGFNFQEVGNLLGLTRSAIQAIKTETIKKIRQAMLRKRLLEE